MSGTLKKIVIIGPESTGKSTIAEDLANYYQTVFVPEFAREYITGLNRPYEEEDLYKIALGQLNAENEKIKKARNCLLFCDTDLYVIKVWSEFKYGRCDPRILQKIAETSYDFYFLTNIDLPWEPDPQREHPEPNMRKYFFEIYREIVLSTGKPWQLLSGTRERRLKTAVQTLNALNFSANQSPLIRKI